jgi:hypothetical protein
MKLQNFKILLGTFLIAFLLGGCNNLKSNKFILADAKIAMGIDDKFMPTEITDTLAAGTSKVFCWFQWRDAPKDTKILAHWHYVTEDLSILDYTFIIPKKSGTGSVSLEMPQGKTLPSGIYRIDLLLDNQKLKSVVFKVLN